MDAQRTDDSFARSDFVSLPLSFYQPPLHLSHDHDHAPYYQITLFAG